MDYLLNLGISDTALSFIENEGFKPYYKWITF